MDIEAIEDERMDSDSFTGLPGSPVPQYVVNEPVIIRGNGNLTVFGLSNQFSTDFPQPLLARLAPEEFCATVEKINGVLKKALPQQMKWIVLGCVCCCCTLGCSMWPVICMSKKTRLSIEKLLDWENSHLYRRLGLKWRLVQMHLDSSSMLEYVLVIDFLPKCHLFLPD
jgi:hypothetical protein